MKEILTKSANMSLEYCCSIVKIKGIEPVENSDFLGKTIVDGYQIVIRRDQVKEGDIMFYASNETELDGGFLSVNNLYELAEFGRNANAAEVKKLIDASNDESLSEECRKEAAAKVDGMHGFFGKNGRVKMIKLRKCPSLGFLFSIDDMAKFCPAVKKIDFSRYFAEGSGLCRDFDTVDGKLFVKAYVPKSAGKKPQTRSERLTKKLKRFDRLVENQFVFHYETQPLNKCMDKFSPDDVVDISVKVHGTSFICGNLKIRAFRKFDTRIKPLDRFLAWLNEKVLPERLKRFCVQYGNVYSSRTVIKNQYLHPGDPGGFYTSDIWGVFSELLNGKLPQGMTVYGEIVGFADGATMIQKDYDYACDPGCSKLMIYRITAEETEKLADGSAAIRRRELNIGEVMEWTATLVERYPELGERIMPFTLLYEGTLANLYPDIPQDEEWGANVLEALKSDEKFGMEKDEPLCRNKVPREGIVVRIKDDPLREAFKLKCNRFCEREGKLIDKGEVDMELAQGNY